ncbi:uncharacterized protein TNCV_4346741 [Trichonephila clavipes]|nr:uncharacterized protein TNCV_4346741 [Trichonephila clavipes]
MGNLPKERLIIPGLTTETTQKLEDDAFSLDEKIKALEKTWVPTSTLYSEFLKRPLWLATTTLNIPHEAASAVTHEGELKELIKYRNKARKTWQQTTHPQHKTELNRTQNIIKRKIYHYGQQAWEDNLSTLKAEDNSLWGIAETLRKKFIPISALTGPTGIALGDTNKIEVIAHSLESQFQLNDIHNPHKDEVITSVVDAYLDSNIDNTDTIPPHSHLKLFRSLESQTQRPPRKRKNTDSGAARVPPSQLSTSHQLLRVVEFIKEGNNKDEMHSRGLP